jgi:PAS domain S-box-containing protein
MEKTNFNDDLVSKLEVFFEISPDLLCVAGFDGYFKRINPAVSALLGYTNEELFSKPINEFVHPDDQDITASVRYELTKNKPLLNFENRYVTKSGEVVWLSWTSMPIESEKLIFAIAKDITHKKKQESERNLLLANLTKINDDLKQLTYTTSHDLRSPVNNLVSLFGMMDVSKISDKETLVFIGLLKKASENLKKTLDSYVNALSQKEDLRVEIEELDLNKTLAKVTNSIQSLIQLSKASIKFDFSEVEKIKFNKVYLESIFLNLITNSIKYARPGQLPVISIYSRKENGFNQLIFSDNGSGFDMEKVKGRVFGLNEKFHSDIDSNGIGLYLVYNHLTSMGGTISLESKINEGATFTMSFKEQ